EGPDGDPDNVWYCSSQNLGLRKTINNGQTTFSVVAGIVDRSVAAFVAPVVMDPNRSNVLLAGTRFVWRTDDGAATWVQNSPQLTNGPVRSFAFAPIDSANTYFAGTSGGSLWRTTDAGANWTLINQGLPSNRVARDIYVHPFHDEVVYVVYSGFGVGH